MIVGLLAVYHFVLTDQQSYHNTQFWIGGKKNMLNTCYDVTVDVCRKQRKQQCSINQLKMPRFLSYLFDKHTTTRIFHIASINLCVFFCWLTSLLFFSYVHWTAGCPNISDTVSKNLLWAQRCQESRQTLATGIWSLRKIPWAEGGNDQLAVSHKMWRKCMALRVIIKATNSKQHSKQMIKKTCLAGCQLHISLRFIKCLENILWHAHRES